ncbi:hypothetical protein GQ53DRAFT_814577 [Thozetella sp. PMI_491]|nr:hypothetical protein GQ53DRAFT_814577 [Thozetella sp. PMI_491]
MNQGSPVPPPPSRDPNSSETPAAATDNAISKKFQWLRPSGRGLAYNSYSFLSSLPATSFDWGDDGHGGSSNYGGELLYLSAPSKKNGVVIVRGNFSTSHYAALSRAQIEFGGPSTFGFEVSRADYKYDTSTEKGRYYGSSFTLGDMIERGCFNYRWPFNEYYLDPWRKDHTAKGQTKHVGTCQMFSCSKDGYFYQIVRIEDGGHFDDGGQIDDKLDKCRHFDADSQIVLTIGGPVWFQPFLKEDRNRYHMLGERGALALDDKPEKVEPHPIKFDFEGKEAKDVSSPRPLKESYETIRYWDTLSTSDADSGTRDLQGGPRTPAYNAIVRLDDTKTTQSYRDHKTRRSATFMAVYRLIEGVPKPNKAPEPTNSVEPNDVSGSNDDPHPNDSLKPNESSGSDQLVESSNTPESKEIATLKLAWTAEPLLPLSSQKLYEFIGVSPSSNKATGALWRTIFTQLKSNLIPTLNLVEATLAGRALEKILQVDMIPAIIDARPNGPEKIPEEEYALVSNLYFWANVDLKSFFWKVRYLVRTHRFLTSLHKLPANPDDDTGTKDGSSGDSAAVGPQQSVNTDATMQESGDKRPQPVARRSTAASHNMSPRKGVTFQQSNIEAYDTKEIVQTQLERIEKRLRQLIAYLVRTMLEPSAHTDCLPILMPDNHVPGEANHFYVLMTIWFVAKNFPKEQSREWKALWTWTSSVRRRIGPTQELPERCGDLFDSTRLPRDCWTFDAADKEKVALLRWYHHGSLHNLCSKGILSADWKDVGLKSTLTRLEREAKVSVASRLCSWRPYTAEDEVIDRLSFLSDELDLEDSPIKPVGMIAYIAAKCVKDRDYTRLVNPGWLPVGDVGSTSGPWEIHALCHHSRLVVLALEEKSSPDWRTKEHTKEAETYKQRIYRFLNAEGTLIPCWERAHVKARKGWLRSEATAVLATTLLSIEESKVLDTLKPAENSQGDEADDDVSDDSSGYTLQHQKLSQEINYMDSIMKDQLDIFERFTTQSDRAPPVSWVLFAPKRISFPSSFRNSLEDTPDRYRKPHLGKITIPVSLLGRATQPSDRDDFEKKNLKGDILNNFWLSDIKATGNTEDKDGFAWSVAPLNKEDKVIDLNGNIRIDRDGKEELCLTWALYDSLIDQEVQHRFVLITDHTLSIDLNDAMIYVVHPEAATCIGNHQLRFSRFACQRGQTWVSHITLRYWRPCTEGTSTDVIAPQVSADDAVKSLIDDRAIPLPSNLANIWRDKVESNDLRFVPEVSSMIISTNDFGDFSKFTIFSDLLDNDKGETEALVEEARKVWQKFVHQPQTARCLVFFLVLGKIVSKITSHYEGALRHIRRIQDLDTTFKRSAKEWAESETAPEEFELGLWSLDALYKLQSSLQASVNSITEAKAVLTEQIKQGPGKRNLHLERMCQEYLGNFESSYVQFAAMNVNLTQRIDMTARFKEGFSAILAMRDTRTSIKQTELSNDQNDISISQNDTVERLTYLTIAYLPITLVTAIFAVPGDQGEGGLFVGKMGLAWFLGLATILSISTWFTAKFIGVILNFINYPAPKPRPQRTKEGPVDWKNAPPNIWRHAGEWNWVKNVRTRVGKKGDNPGAVNGSAV